MRRARLSTAILFLIFGAVEATWASRIPLIRDRLELTDAGLSLALVGPAVGLLLAARMAPPLVNRVDHARASRAAVLASAACLVLPALAWNLASLTVALAIWGACLGTLDVTMNARGSALERRQDRSLLSGLHASYSSAVLLFAPIGAAAASLAITPLVHFAVVAAICAAAALLFGPSSRETLMPTRSEDSGFSGDRSSASGVRPRLILWRHPELFGLAFIGFCALVAEGSVANWSGVFLRQADHSSLASAPLALTAFSSGMVVARLLGDHVIMRWGHYSVLWRAAALAAVGMTLAVTTSSLVLALMGYATLGLGLSVLIPIVFSLSAKAPGVPSIWALSRMTTATYVGLFLGPPVIGLLSTALTLRRALLCVAGLLLVVATIGRALGHRQSAQSNPTQGESVL